MRGELDRLSNLPSEITEQILLLLSTREAARTSVLSSKWRYKWAKLPCLVFNENCISSATTHSKIVTVVDHLLLLHTGPLHKFVLVHRNLRGTQDIDRWILHLSRNSIREFFFHIYGTHPYQLPSSCRDMKKLGLLNCLLKPPSTTFMGYPNLEILILSSVTLSQDEVESLIICCPLLKFLYLIDCGGFTRLKVAAPKLSIFNFKGVFEDLFLEQTVNLWDVRIALEENVGRIEASNSSRNLAKFLVQLPHTQILHIHDYFLKACQDEQVVLGEVYPRLPDDVCNFTTSLTSKLD